MAEKIMLSADVSAETNVRRAKRKTGSYLGAVRVLGSTANLMDGKRRKAKRRFKNSQLLALHKKAKQIR